MHTEQAGRQSQQVRRETAVAMNGEAEVQAQVEVEADKASRNQKLVTFFPLFLLRPRAGWLASYQGRLPFLFSSLPLTR